MKYTVTEILQQAFIAENQRNIQQAANCYQAVLQAEPFHPVANFRLGLIALSSQQFESALQLLKRATDTNPNSEEYWDRYIDALVKTGKIKLAKQKVKHAKKNNLFLSKVGYWEKQLKNQSGHKMAANKKIQTPTEEMKHDLITKYQTGQIQPALESALILSKKYPHDPMGWKVLGALYIQTGDLHASLKANQKLIKITPDDPEAHSIIALAQHNLGELEQAVNSYQQAIQLMPNYADAHNNLGNTLTELGRFELAEKHLKQAISINPKHVQAHYNLGLLLSKVDRVEDAIQSYTTALGIEPTYKEALLDRGQLLFQQSQYQQALNDFDKCDTPVSREKALLCLDKLNRVDDVYNRLANSGGVDATNLRVAAFSSFIAERENRETANNFCQKPLDFLHFSQLANHTKDTEQFIAAVINDLKNVDTVWEPGSKTTRKGHQSLGDVFKSKGVNLAKLKQMIAKEMQEYYKKFQDESCLLIQQWPKDINIVGWHVVLQTQGHQKVHIHPDRWLSGVIYLQVVPSMDNDEGAIEFCMDGENYSHPGTSRMTYQPLAGDIVLFPSSLNHRTVPFSSDKERIVIAFDLLPELK